MVQEYCPFLVNAGKGQHVLNLKHVDIANLYLRPQHTIQSATNRYKNFSKNEIGVKSNQFFFFWLIIARVITNSKRFLTGSDI